MRATPLFAEIIRVESEKAGLIEAFMKGKVVKTGCRGVFLPLRVEKVSGRWTFVGVEGVKVSGIRGFLLIKSARHDFSRPL